MYKVNEIFYSLQGEGRWMGRPAVFVRMSGCNLKCPFCDTDFKGYKEMSAEDILTACLEKGGDCRFIVLTGGEPTLQVDAELIQLLHQQGYYLSMEPTAPTWFLRHRLGYLFAKVGLYGGW